MSSGRPQVLSSFLATAVSLNKIFTLRLMSTSSICKEWIVIENFEQQSHWRNKAIIVCFRSYGN